MMEARVKWVKRRQKVPLRLIMQGSRPYCKKEWGPHQEKHICGFGCEV